MKHFAQDSELNSKLIGLLLRPSWLSGLIAGLGSAGLIVFSIVSSHYNGSNARLQFLNYKAADGGATSQAIGRTLDSNKLISNLPLLLFWMLIGLIVYLFAANVVNLIRETRELNVELASYTNVNRRTVIRDALEKLLIRLVVVAVWVPYILFFFHTLVPYVIALALAASPQLASVVGIEYIVLAFTVLFFGLHMHTLLVRLLLLKPRLFSRALYVD